VSLEIGALSRILMTPGWISGATATNNWPDALLKRRWDPADLLNEGRYLDKG